ncbi:hypothetical protein DJ83_14830 [Halorubrum ezzemoulense]|uniref:HNH nuclease domain-containing protein n=1 Tax=Halorubrum ezzemoulense TaxID=337243 RepID=A0A256IQE7_HALEZ|nr:HNH endonuclease signature motif containing protein [Halorubrum ezzemoulense]OYR58516.1 hypothetical protein DJ83_14830 [Halorubrum ezzemoulense]
MADLDGVAAAKISRVTDRGNCVARYANTEYDLGRLSTSNTGKKVLIKINEDEASKLYIENEWTTVELGEISKKEASLTVSSKWNLRITNEIHYYDLENIYINFEEVFEHGDNIRVQINEIDSEAHEVLASPLLISGGLYNSTGRVSKIDEHGRGVIGTRHDQAQILIKEFGGMGSEKIVFQIHEVNGPQAIGIRYFYPGERLYVTPDGDLSSDTCYKQLSDSRRLIINDAQTSDGRVEIEVTNADFDEVVARRYTPDLAEENKDKNPNNSISTQTTPKKSAEANSGSITPQDDNLENRVSNTEVKKEENRANGEEPENNNVQSRRSESGSDQLGPTEQTQKRDSSDGITQSEAVEDTSETSSYGNSLDDLRKKAVDDAVEKVPKKNTSTNQSTQQYNRSKAVKDYVKARADGQCEACEESAPFTSKTGDPYLHAHHVHELSDGGSDTPDTVIALCPNCHHRVHHGRNGSEYNQLLIEKLEQIE